MNPNVTACFLADRLSCFGLVSLRCWIRRKTSAFPTLPTSTHVWLAKAESCGLAAFGKQRFFKSASFTQFRTVERSIGWPVSSSYFFEGRNESSGRRAIISWSCCSVSASAGACGRRRMFPFFLQYVCITGSILLNGRPPRT